MPDNDGAASAKAQDMFIRKYGKKAFLEVHDKLHERFDLPKPRRYWDKVGGIETYKTNRRYGYKNLCETNV